MDSSAHSSRSSSDAREDDADERRKIRERERDGRSGRGRTLSKRARVRLNEALADDGDGDDRMRWDRMGDGATPLTVVWFGYEDIRTHRRRHHVDLRLSSLPSHRFLVLRAGEQGDLPEAVHTNTSLIRKAITRGPDSPDFVDRVITSRPDDEHRGLGVSTATDSTRKGVYSIC
ncbi:hypothetical protein PVAR5_2898 [Paecilomyces variotii No. 5]|uniref:Uncharacterized protein n=1 Tax=Byssochlamys spectabilis (strain No. 5 / NBRC 109023) TaxID=1356009 RepID=V5FBW3_BYSSN|nr:hypothetical protein PVAR5_2898 [Paecilomyces variotii No. 5]